MSDRCNETECDVEPAAAQNIARRLVRDWRVLQAWAERHRDAAPQGSHDRRFYDGRALSFATCIEQLCAAFGMEAKMGDGMGHANECVTSTLDDVLSEASKRVAEWPDWKRSDDVKRRQAEFDARMKGIGLEYAHTSMTDIGDGAVAAAETRRLRDLDEAREVGRAEMRAEADRLRAELTATVAALARREEEIEEWKGVAEILAKSKKTLIVDVCQAIGVAPSPAVNVVAEVRRRVDAAYRRGQEEMREWASTWCDSEASKMQSRGEHSQASTLWHAYQEIRAIPIANAPAVSSVGTGEADPVERGVETAGAVESVARESDAAAEIARLRSALGAARASLQEHVRDTAEWQQATSCETPAAAKRRIDQLVADLSLARENRAHFAEAASDRREKLRERPTQRAREPKEGDRVMFGSASGPHVAILLEFIPHAGPEGRGRVRDLETLEVHEAWPGNSLVRGTFKLID